MHACVLVCVWVCRAEGEEQVKCRDCVSPGALKAVLRGHHFLPRTLGSPLADLSLRSVIGTARAAGCEALCSPSPPPPIPQLQPPPSLPGLTWGQQTAD